MTRGYSPPTRTRGSRVPLATGWHSGTRVFTCADAYSRVTTYTSTFFSTQVSSPHPPRPSTMTNDHTTTEYNNTPRTQPHEPQNTAK